MHSSDLTYMAVAPGERKIWNNKKCETIAVKWLSLWLVIVVTAVMINLNWIIYDSIKCGGWVYLPCDIANIYQSPCNYARFSQHQKRAVKAISGQKQENCSILNCWLVRNKISLIIFFSLRKFLTSYFNVHLLRHLIESNWLRKNIYNNFLWATRLATLSITAHLWLINLVS